MGAAREFHRIAEGHRGRARADADAEPAPWREASPGKSTLVEQLLARLEGRVTDDGRAARCEPGRRTLVGDAGAPRLEFDDHRVLGLRDVLQRLASEPALRQATLATAAGADRTVAGRATLWREPLSGPTTTNGQVMHQVAERHAATLFRKAAGDAAVDPDDHALADALARCGTGRPLPDSIRRELERELAIPLGGVRIHCDAVAAAAARAVHAEAFTVGEDVFFAEHAFAPDTPAGRQLLAHELAHVAQNRRGDGRTAHRGLQISRPGDPLEREADAVASRFGAAPLRRPQSAALPTAQSGATHQTGPITAVAVVSVDPEDGLISDPAFDASPAMAIPAAVRARLEPALGVDLGDIAIHEQPRLADHGIRALTRGSAIYFAPGELALDHERGVELLAHEVVHVAQRGATTTHLPGLVRVSDDRAAEAQAEHVAAAASRANGLPVAWTPVAATGEAHASWGKTRQRMGTLVPWIKAGPEWYRLPPLHSADGKLFDVAGGVEVEFDPPSAADAPATIKQIIANGQLQKNGWVKVKAGQHAKRYRVGQTSLNCGTEVTLTWVVTDNTTVGAPTIVLRKRALEQDAPATPSELAPTTEPTSSQPPPRKKQKRSSGPVPALQPEPGADEMATEPGTTEVTTEPVISDEDVRRIAFTKESLQQINKALGAEHKFSSNFLMPYEGSKRSIRSFVLHELLAVATNQTNVAHIVEPFMGAATIFLNWPQDEHAMQTHVMGDINRHGIGLLEVLRDSEAEKLKELYDTLDGTYQSNKVKFGAKQPFDDYLDELNGEIANPVASQIDEQAPQTNRLSTNSEDAIQKALRHIYFSEMTRQGIHQERQRPKQQKAKQSKAKRPKAKQPKAENDRQQAPEPDAEAPGLEAEGQMRWTGTFAGEKALDSRKKDFSALVDEAKTRFEATEATFHCQDWRETIALAKSQHTETKDETFSGMELEEPPMPGTIVYCDSPYPKSDEESDTCYGDEFTMAHLGELMAAAETLARQGTSVVVSNYHSPDSEKLVVAHSPTLMFLFPVVHMGVAKDEMLLIYAPPSTELNQSVEARQAHLAHLQELVASRPVKPQPPKRERPRQRKGQPKNNSAAPLEDGSSTRQAGNCLYDAVRDILGGNAAPVSDLRRIATDWVLHSQQLHDELMAVNESMVDNLVSVLVTPGKWYGEQEAGNLAPKVLASILGRSLLIVSCFGTDLRVYRIPPYDQPSEQELTIFFHDNHYTAHPQSVHAGWLLLEVRTP